MIEMNEKDKFSFDTKTIVEYGIKLSIKHSLHDSDFINEFDYFFNDVVSEVFFFLLAVVN